MLLVKNIQKWNSLFCLLVNRTYVMITYWRIRYTLIIFALTSLVTVPLIKLIQIPICLEMWFWYKTFYNQPKTKECRPTQIKTGENNKQKNMPKNKKFRSVSTHLIGKFRSVKIQMYGSGSGEETMIRQRLFNKDEYLKNCSYINSGAAIRISTCTFTKNRSYIDSGASIHL